MKRTDINRMEDNRMAEKNGFTVKVAAAAAAAVLFVGVPLGLGISKLANNEHTLAAPLTAAESAVTEAAEVNIIDKASAGVTASTDDTSLKPAKTVQDKETKKTEPAPVAPEGVVMDTDTFVDQMLAMDSSQLRELSGNEYDIVNAAYTQIAMFGIKCKAFPDYVFVPEQYNRFSDRYDESSDNITVPVYGSDGEDNSVMLGEKIRQINVYGNAQIGNGANVGMRYNELEAALGQNLYMTNTGSSLGLAAWARIDGRSWLLHFKLTEEQEAEVLSRIDENVRNGGEAADVDPDCVDISDIDPVCDIAVLDIR